MNVSSNPVIEALERFLPSLHAMAQQLRSDFPNISVNVWSSATGSATTDNPAHDLGIDCEFKYAPQDQADCVTLYIGVIQVNDDPHLSDLTVCGGAGSEGIGIDLLEYPVPWSVYAIRKIEDALPTLFDGLIAALRNPPFPNLPP